MAQRDGFSSTFAFVCEIWSRYRTNGKCMPLPFKEYLIPFTRRSLLPTYLPVICLLEPCQASSMLRYRSIPDQMRRSMEPASRHSNTKGIMMNCESLEHIKGHVLTGIKNLNTSTYSRSSILPAVAGSSHRSPRPRKISSGSHHQRTR